MQNKKEATKQGNKTEDLKKSESPLRIALCMIVKPTDQEAWLLNRCLGSVSPHVDGIFITQAGPEPNEKVSKVVSDWNGIGSFYKWNNSFADARNFNFSQVPEDYDYILWLDADDMLRGGEKLRETIEANPSVDAFSFWYLYAFDRWKNPIVVHHKTRVIRNDGCVEWVGDLHEDFRGHRQVVSRHVEGIEVLHLTTDDRVEVAKKRNVTVAKNHHKNAPDDPRSFWNLANAYKADMQLEKAMENFEIFMKMSESEDEKYIARLRMAECSYFLGDQTGAIENYQHAIGIKPLYPDAYIQLGRLFYETGAYEKAVPLLKHSLTLEPPIYKIVVYNPRDYDYTPMKWLAYCYYELNQPILAYELFKGMLEITPEDKELEDIVEKLSEMADMQEKMLKEYARIKELPLIDMKAALNALPEEYQSNPMFANLRNVNFVKTESSGRDMTILCGYTVRQWNGTAEKEGIGGSEEAVINLARIYAKAGWNVTVYNNCGHKAEKIDGVTYAPFWTWNYRDKTDVTILWRHPKMLDYAINSTKIYLDMHDVIGAGELNKKRLDRVTKIFVKSKFHRSLYPDVPDDKFVIIPNGIKNSDFEGAPFKKEPFLMVNTSSGDRAMEAMVRIFPKIKKRIPEAKLEWAYGWETFLKASKNPEKNAWVEGLEAKMKELGIVNHGRLSHEEVAKLSKRAMIYFYPTEFAEIDCISARKAQAAGAWVIATDFSALNETVKYGTLVESKKTKDTWSKPYQYDFSADPELDDEFVDAVEEAFTDSLDHQVEMNKWSKQFDWQKIGERWLKEIES